ncbi:hypothetical protein [Mycobacterium attenuatum]|uniref:hypothetical protein n=1 Tax=Mycobacterium attenuatum TaxID=2341086 RepID=UPI000F044C7E|nr:hypothetical protein [Mycobacterium attenuatum]
MLVVAVIAVVYAAVSLGREQAAAQETVVTVGAPGPAYSPEQIQAAKTKACGAWDTGALAIGAASRSVAATPKDWDDPITKSAVAAQSRTLLVESAFIRVSMDPATPPELQALLTEYLDRGFAIQDAELHHLGTRADALTNAEIASGLATRIETFCGLK